MHCNISILSEERTNLCLFLSFFVSVSSKPKEPGAAVVAPGRSSPQPSVWQGVHRRRRWSGTEVRGSLPHIPFSSSLWGTGLLMALSNLTRVCFWGEEERRLKVTAGRGQPTFIQSHVCFFSFQEDAMMLRDSSTGQCSYFGIRVV